MEGSMSQLGIEESLRGAHQELYDRYAVLKNRLLSKEYPFAMMRFEGGNDHGPGHIQRVLEKLDQLLGADPLTPRLINTYELFLTMMSVLYHDVGMLRAR